MTRKARSTEKAARKPPINNIDQLEQIINAIREAVWLRDAKTREILYVNPAFENLFGYTCQYFCQNPESMLDLVHPDDKERVAKAIKSQYQNIPFNEEYRIVRPDGSVRWIRGRSVLLFDKNGEIDRFVALSEDITARVESEQQFKILAEHSPNMIFINKLGVVAYCNAKCEELMGYSREDICSPEFNFSILIAPEYVGQIQANFLKHKKGEDVPPMQYLLVKKDGTKFDAIISTKLIDYENSKAILGIITDISEHVRALNELKDSENRFRAIFECSRDAFSLEKSGVLVLCNQSFLDLFGYNSFEECIGKPTINHVVQEERSRIGSYTVLRSRGEGAPLLYETRGRKKDDTPFDLEVRVSPYMSHGEAFTLVTLVDVSERKRAEIALQTSLKEKEVLLREVHHRVKNNMQIISSLLRLQSTDIEGKSVKEIFENCHNRIRSMSLVHEKLYLSKNLSGINVADYFNSLIGTLFQFYKIDSSIIKVKTDLKEVYFDIQTSIPCGLILNELISNSLKHAFPNGRLGEIDISLQPAGKDAFRLEVGDNGIGIPAETEIDKVSSFGLKVVKMLVEQLDGTLELRKGSGTRYSITFKDSLYKPRI